jgi:HEAT repeat protein
LLPLLALSSLSAQEVRFLNVPQSRWAQDLRSPQPAVRRSAAFALGKLGVQSAHLSPSLLYGLSDADAGVREAAAFAFGEIGPTAHTERVIPALRKVLKDSDPRVRRSAAFALGRMGKEAMEAAPDLLGLLGDAKPGVRQNAAFALGQLELGAEALATVLPALCKALAEDADALVRRDAALALGKIGRDAHMGVKLLLDRSRNDSDVVVRRTALDVLVGVVTPEDKDIAVDLKKLLKSGDADSQRSAALALANIGGSEAEPAVPLLCQSLKKDADLPSRRVAVAALLNIGPYAVEAVPHLMTALSDSDTEVRRGAALCLARIGPDAREAIPTLLKMMQPGEPDEVRMFVAEALANIDPDEAEVVKTLIRVLQERENWAVRHRATWALKRLKDLQRPGVVEALTRLLGEKEPEARVIRYEAAHALGMRLGDRAPDRTIDVLLEVLRDRDLLIYTGARANVRGGGSEQGNAEAKVGTSAAGDWRREGAKALARIGTRAARPEVIEALKRLAAESEDPSARDAAKAALKVLMPG